MKDIHFLYIIAVLAIIGISATFIGYATDRLPVYTPRQIGTTTSVNTDSTNAEKGCGCCNEDSRRSSKNSWRSVNVGRLPHSEN